MEDFIKTFDIQKFPGEDVTKASLRIKAVAQSLGTHRLPSDIVHRVLEGFARSSTPSFSTLCNHQESMMSSSLVKASLRHDSLYKTLISVLSDLETKYLELLSGQRWLGVGNNTVSPPQTFHVNADSASVCSDDDEYDDYVAFTIHTGRRTTPFDVWVKNKVCRKCNKVGHIQRDCPLNQSRSSSSSTMDSTTTPRNISTTRHDKHTSKRNQPTHTHLRQSSNSYAAKVQTLLSAARDLTNASAHVTTHPITNENPTDTLTAADSSSPSTDDYAGFFAALGCPKE